MSDVGLDNIYCKVN
jgi:hypothetical protein